MYLSFQKQIFLTKIRTRCYVTIRENGGSIFFIADHYNADRNKNRWDSSEVFNGYRRGAWDNPAKGMSNDEANSQAMQGVESSDWLSDNFGIRFRYNAIGDVSAKNIVSPEQSFGITEGVSSVAMHAGSTLAITNPKLAKGLVYLPETRQNGITLLIAVYITAVVLQRVLMLLSQKSDLEKLPLLETLLLLKMLRQNTFVKILVKQRKLTMDIKKTMLFC